MIPTIYFIVSLIVAVVSFGIGRKEGRVMEQKKASKIIVALMSALTETERNLKRSLQSLGEEVKRNEDYPVSRNN